MNTLLKFLICAFVMNAATVTFAQDRAQAPAPRGGILCISSIYKIKMFPNTSAKTVDVEISSIYDINQPVVNLVAKNLTDPQESSWPVFVQKEVGFSFYTQEQGMPESMKVNNEDIAEDTRCIFMSRID